MTPLQRQQLADVLSTFDEEGLIALANKGLVRRALKDLETVGDIRVEELEAVLLVIGPDWTVRMPVAGPIQATDDTPASGITRQILTATIWLRMYWHKDVPPPPSAHLDAGGTNSENAEPVPSAMARLMALLSQMTTGDLEKWASQTLLQEATATVDSGMEVVIELTTLLRIQFPGHDVEVRLMPTPSILKPGRAQAQVLLQSCLSTAPQAFHARWVLIAMLMLRQELGPPLVDRVRDGVGTQTDSPRSRTELLTSIQRFLEATTVTGISHPSDVMVQRLFAFSVSCIGQHLPRLARLLRGLASELQLAIDRHARSDAHRILDRLAETYALTLALLNAGETVPRALAGRHRSQYDPLGALQGLGCGAYPWRTPTGFEGVTLLVWDCQRKRFWSWSESRPVETRGFNLAAIYRTASVWAGSGTPESLSRRHFLAADVLANHAGRLSTSQRTHVAEAKRVTATAADYQLETFGEAGFTDWSLLQERCRTTRVVGFAERDPLRSVVVLFPTAWGVRTYEESQQRLIWKLMDVGGRVLNVVVPWTTLTEGTIDCLEALHPDRDQLFGVIGLLDDHAPELRLFPVAFLSHGTVQGDVLINPAFDRQRLRSPHDGLLQTLRAKYGRDHIPSTLVLEDDDEVGTGQRRVLTAGLEQRLAAIEAYLQRLAETGGDQLGPADQQQARELSQQADWSGFTELTAPLLALAAGDRVPHDLLLARYICQLYRAAAAQAVN